jgi:hypothetical protein
VVNLVQPDSNPNNNQDSSVVTLQPLKDVAVNIRANPSTVVVGGAFNYTINM